MFEKTLSIEEPGLVNPQQKIRLYQNVPNPFTGITTIGWSSEISGQTVLKVFNIHGQEIATLLKKNMPAGKHSVDFDGSHLSKGVYYYQLKIGNFILAKKCIVL